MAIRDRSTNRYICIFILKHEHMNIKLEKSNNDQENFLNNQPIKIIFK